MIFRIEDNAGPKNVTKEILAHWLPEVKSLPNATELRRFLDEPLHERAKIPLDRFAYECFITSVHETSDVIGRDDINMLFRIDDHERADGLCCTFYLAIMDSPPGNYATEGTFVSFWDGNIRNIMETLIPAGTSIRDRPTSQHPNFGFLYFNTCPFRGEETSPSNTRNPRAELADKMTWTYDPAPYVLGKLFRFMALCHF
jgi:hypothetical protein